MVELLQSVCGLVFYRILSQLVPGANKAYESVLSNREKWEKFQ